MKFKKSKKYFLADIILKTIYILIALIVFIITSIVYNNEQYKGIFTKLATTSILVIIFVIIGLISSIKRYIKKKTASTLSIVSSFISGNFPCGILFLIAKYKYVRTKEVVEKDDVIKVKEELKNEII